MSKGSGMGRKRSNLKMNKGMDKCDSGSHSKQCGRMQKVSKGEHLINLNKNVNAPISQEE